MADFTFKISPNIILGSYSASRLGQFALEYGTRFMLVLDPVLRSVGIADKITQSLTDRNVDYFVFDEFTEIAETKTVSAALELARKSHIHGVISAGGGKAVNIARAVCTFFNETKDIYDFTDGDVPKSAPLPLISLATTCRDPYVFTDRIPLVDSRSSKCILFRTKSGLCKASVFDPNLSVTLTENQTESMSLESLCLASEAFLSQKANFFSDMLAEKSIELLNFAMNGSESLNLTTPHEELLTQGGCMASLAIASSSFGPASLLALTINARFKISRSLVSAILFPHVIEDCIKFKSAKVERIAELFGIERQDSSGAEEFCKVFADNIRQRMAKANLPTRLKDLSVTIEQLSLAAEDAGQLEYVNSLPRSMTSDDLFDLIKTAF